MKIGMRNIKTALAVFICIIISRLFKLEYPFYAAIAAIISMQSSITNSFKTGKNRMLGTFIGAVVGLMCALIQPGNPILCALGIIIVIYLCNILNWKASTSIAGIVFLAIMLNLKGASPLKYSINRLGDTFIGIIVAVLVNYYIFPPNNLEEICTNCSEIAMIMNDLVKEKFCYDANIDMTNVENSISELHKRLDISMNESNINEKIDKAGEILSACSRVYDHLKIVQSLDGECDLNMDNINRLNSFYRSNLKLDHYEKRDVNIIYNYHVSKIIDELEIMDSVKNFF